MSFGERLKSLRIEKSLSQKGLASAAGLSQQAVAAYELGTREPGWTAIQNLAAALGVSCVDFQVQDDGREQPPPPAAEKPLNRKRAGGER